MAIGGGIALFLVGLFVAIPLIGVFWYNHVRNELVSQETTLNAQYQANQNELDAFVKKIKEQFSVAEAKADKLNIVLENAVRGRYDGELSSAKPGQGELFSAIVEAYPDLSGLDIYDRLITEISAGREAFKQVQNKLLDQLRPYEAYRKRGVIHSQMVNIAGYPALEARIGKQRLTGKDALDQMLLIVTSKDTSQSFVTGEQEPLDLRGNSGTTTP